MIAKLIALVIHEVVTEYRKLDQDHQAGDERVGDVEHGPGELSCTSADTERVAAWDHDTRAPVTAGLGYRYPG